MDEEKKKINDLLNIDEKEIIESCLMKEEFEAFDYKLPDFDCLCEDFDIEKAYEKESSFILREVRKVIMEKLSAYLQLFETFMNPSSPPVFVFGVLRNVSDDDKDLIKKIYKDLTKYQLWSVKLDTIYSEEKEADYIIHAFDEWQTLKKEIYVLIERLEKGEKEKPRNSNSGYFN